MGVLTEYQIDSGADRAAFALTCSAFYRGFLSTTWKDVELEFSPRNVPDYPLDAWTGPWTARIGHVKVDKWSSCVNTDLLYDGVTDGTYSDFGRHLCSEPLCRRSTLLRMLGPFFVLCSPGKIPERPRSLTVRGRFAEFSESIWPPQIGCHAPGINQVMKVKAFIFEKYWEFFDISMLNMVSWKYLCILKVPVKYPTDCVFLGKMIKRMPALKSLTIVDLPDNHLYFKSYKYLGRGIIARAASLQELDISFTNFNRPNPYKASKEWCGIWIEPQPPTLHFQKIFRQSKKTTEERKRLMFIDRRNNIHSSIESVDHSPGPLRLKKLRLRNMTIPDYASNEVFNWSCLNELELLNSKVDDQIWRDLQCTQLTSLRAIDYSILPGAFMKFLATQKSLETITFTRPADIYKERGWAPWNGEPMLRIKLAHEAPAQGPGTTAGMRALVKANRRKGNHAAIPQYPTFSELMECLQRDRLKELSIPVDMYDVTPEIVGRIGDLPNLEQLTWGFDYSDQVSTEMKCRYQTSNTLNRSSKGPSLRAS